MSVVPAPPVRGDGEKMAVSSWKKTLRRGETRRPEGWNGVEDARRRGECGDGRMGSWASGEPVTGGTRICSMRLYAACDMSRTCDSAMSTTTAYTIRKRTLSLLCSIAGVTGSEAIGDATDDCIPGEIPTEPYKSKPPNQLPSQTHHNQTTHRTQRTNRHRRQRPLPPTHQQRINTHPRRQRVRNQRRPRSLRR